MRVRSRPTHPTRALMALGLCLLAASGCTELIGANEPTARQEDSSVPAFGADAAPGADANVNLGIDAIGPYASVDGTVVDDAGASEDFFEAAAKLPEGAMDAGDEPRGEAAPPDAGHSAGTDGGGDGPAQAIADAAAPDGACGDATSDPKNCGACGHDCTALPHVSGPVTCEGSGQCAFSLSSCAPGWTHCNANPDQGCETNISTASNCGACGSSCPTSAPVCSGSGSTYSCVTGCSGALSTLCSGTCVDTATDPGNCGACGSRCLGGEQCVSSSCRCTGGTRACAGACVANDDSACGPSCAPCVAPTGGTVTCNGTSCVQACTTPGDVACANVCVNESTDVGNCGACGVTCTGMTPLCVSRSCVACTSGAQCIAGNTPQSCVNNQWVSQAPCSGTTPVCLDGACVACASGTQCAAGWVQGCIGGQWVNQTMCLANQVCRAAACVAAVHDVGQDTALASTFTLAPNYMYLFRLPQLAHSATVLGFGAYGTATTSALAKMAIYADDGTGTAPTGEPLAWIGTFLALSSGQVQQTANTTGPLSASTYYWLGIDVDAMTPIYSQASSGVGTGFPQTYGTYPSGMGGSSYSGMDLAIYISVQDLN